MSSAISLSLAQSVEARVSLGERRPLQFFFCVLAPLGYYYLPSGCAPVFFKGTAKTTYNFVLIQKAGKFVPLYNYFSAIAEEFAFYLLPYYSELGRVVKNGAVSWKGKLGYCQSSLLKCSRAPSSVQRVLHLLRMVNLRNFAQLN